MFFEATTWKSCVDRNPRLKARLYAHLALELAD
jgi:hypothetical protein